MATTATRRDPPTPAVVLTGRPLRTDPADEALRVATSERSRLSKAAGVFDFSVLVLGPRGAGKTTLLRGLMTELAGSVFVNAEQAETPQDLIVDIAAAVAPGRPRRSPESVATEIDVWEMLTAAPAPLPAAAAPLPGTPQRPRPARVFVDGCDAEQLTTLFGVCRDTLWDIPDLRWVVAARGDVTDPGTLVSSFFGSTIPLASWNSDALSELLTRRVAGTGLLEPGLVHRLAAAIAPAHPAQALAALRAALAAGTTPDELITRIETGRDAVNALNEPLRRLHAALDEVGPAHAGSRTLLARLGVTRSAAARGLRSLAAAGLVSTTRDGRRVRYATSRYCLLH